jgi:hypothetical protein
MGPRWFALVALVLVSGCWWLNAECRHNSDCASGLCVKVTIDTGPRCSASLPGARCDWNGDCASHTCDGGTCACLDEDAACSATAQCCVGTCVMSDAEWGRCLVGDAGTP